MQTIHQAPNSIDAKMAQAAAHSARHGKERDLVVAGIDPTNVETLIRRRPHHGGPAPLGEGVDGAKPTASAPPTATLDATVLPVSRP